MRRLISSFAVLTTVLGSAVASHAGETFAVPIDQSAPLTLPAGAQRVMIGNPGIADVNVVDTRTVVLLGRTYGATNLLVLDSRGRVLMDRQIVVSAPDYNRVTMYHSEPGALLGPKVENYACSPRCERVPMPGEPELDFNRYAVGYVGYNARATEARNTGGSARPNP